jgi:hypothetical protein
MDCWRHGQLLPVMVRALIQINSITHKVFVDAAGNIFVADQEITESKNGPLMQRNYSCRRKWQEVQ